MKPESDLHLVRSNVSSSLHGDAGAEKLAEGFINRAFMLVEAGATGGFGKGSFALKAEVAFDKGAIGRTIKGPVEFEEQAILGQTNDIEKQGCNPQANPYE